LVLGIIFKAFAFGQATGKQELDSNPQWLKNPFGEETHPWIDLSIFTNHALVLGLSLGFISPSRDSFTKHAQVLGISLGFIAPSRDSRFNMREAIAVKPHSLTYS